MTVRWRYKAPGESETSHSNSIAPKMGAGKARQSPIMLHVSLVLGSSGGGCQVREASGALPDSVFLQYKHIIPPSSRVLSTASTSQCGVLLPNRAAECAADCWGCVTRCATGISRRNVSGRVSVQLGWRAPHISLAL